MSTFATRPPPRRRPEEKAGDTLPRPRRQPEEKPGDPLPRPRRQPEEKAGDPLPRPRRQPEEKPGDPLPRPRRQPGERAGERGHLELLAAFAALALAACGSDPTVAPAPAFTFAPVAGMACADGSPTGVGVSRGRDDAVLVFLNGGGACWGASACAASRGPFGAADMALAQQLVGSTILDRQLAGNPFAGFTMVFVPYCTGDVHAGDADRVYGGVPWQHHGRRNLEAALAWIATTLPRPARVVVAGSSAGGFGALLAYDLVRTRWPEGGPSPVSAALVDDSGPTLVGSALPASLRTAWWDAWNLGSTVTPLCPGCQDDLSQIWGTLSAAHPSDRFALLSSTQDATMRLFFGGMTGTEFMDALGTLAGFIDGLPDQNARVFRVAGTDHPLLLAPAAHVAGTAPLTTPLLEWLSPLATGTGPFVSTGP